MKSKFKYDPQAERGVEVPPRLPPITISIHHKNRRAEWLGDALLRFYARQFLIEKFPKASVSELEAQSTRLQMNKSLKRFASLHGLASADQVEIKLYEAFTRSDEAARVFAWKLFNFLTDFDIIEGQKYE